MRVRIYCRVIHKNHRMICTKNKVALSPSRLQPFYGVFLLYAHAKGSRVRLESKEYKKVPLPVTTLQSGEITPFITTWGRSIG